MVTLACPQMKRLVTVQLFLEISECHRFFCLSISDHRMSILSILGISTSDTIFTTFDLRSIQAIWVGYVCFFPVTSSSLLFSFFFNAN